jgi:hypothetical protein
MNFTARVKEMGNDFISRMQIFSAKLACELRCPEGFILRFIAGAAEINVNGLIKTICRIGNFPDGINNLIAGAIGYITGVRDLYSRRRAITVDLTKWLTFKIAARQRLILIPVLFGNVITPVSRSMRRRMVPDEIILPLFIVVFAQRVGLWLSSCEKLLFPRWPVYHQAALPFRKTARLLDALRFPLHRTAVGVFP